MNAGGTRAGLNYTKLVRSRPDTTMRHTTMRHSTSLAATLAAVALAFACATQAQQLYRWVDKDGRVTYSQTPPPPSAAAKPAQARDLRGSVVEGADMPFATRQAAKDFPVVLYTSPDCGPMCRDARDSLAKRGIPFREVSVADEKTAAELKTATGKATVPTLTVGRDSMAGFDPEAWKSALDTAGYPANAGAQPPRAAAAKPAATGKPLPAVKLYVNSACGEPCNGARQVLNQHKVRFESIAVEDAAGIEALRKLSGEATVPVMVVGENVMRGFDAARYEIALAQNGYVLGSAQPQGPDPAALAGPRGRYAPPPGEAPVQAGRYATPTGEAPAQPGRYLPR